MAFTAPNVYRSATLDGTYTALNGVQFVGITRGKARFQDPYSASTCVIELIPDATYALPFAIGQFIDIRDTNSGSSSAYFNGRIVDIERKYDIPYNSTSGYAPGDRFTITVQGGTGTLAGYYGIPQSRSDCYYGMVNDIGGGTTYVYNPLPFGEIGIPFATPPVDLVNPQNNESANWLDFFNLVLATCQYAVDEYDMARTPIYYSGDPYNLYVGLVTRPNSDATKAFTLTDNYSGAANTYKYNSLQFASSKQSAFTQVTVQPAAYEKQVASTGVPPYNGIIYNSYSASTTAAGSLATYVLNTNSNASSTPFTVATSTDVDSNTKTLAKLAEAPIGTAVTITFRGTTTYALLVGCSVAIYPDKLNLSFNFAPSTGTPFTLDSTAFGVLDTNRLGYP